jgi:hypothetical protein
VEIHCTIQLDNDDSLAYTPDAAAMQVLVALGGNATKDVCYVTVTQAAAGSAGPIAQLPANFNGVFVSLAGISWIAS